LKEKLVGILILDTKFDFSTISNIRKKEVELKTIPGILEVGLFTRCADVYYKANNDGSFEIIKL
jgi:ribose 5-phosphate isomerase A